MQRCDVRAWGDEGENCFKSTLPPKGKRLCRCTLRTCPSWGKAKHLEATLTETNVIYKGGLVSGEPLVCNE